mmetsp:Transcript_26866/g.55058  ORF Transcript_26866/g.55058 Transcript_26866/m.55058 type:complete len:240 (+) Transcript_26866:381-1100(+)
MAMATTTDPSTSFTASASAADVDASTIPAAMGEITSCWRRPRGREIEREEWAKEAMATTPSKHFDRVTKIIITTTTIPPEAAATTPTTLPAKPTIPTVTTNSINCWTTPTSPPIPSPPPSRPPASLNYAPKPNGTKSSDITATASIAKCIPVASFGSWATASSRRRSTRGERRGWRPARRWCICTMRRASCRYLWICVWRIWRGGFWGVCSSEGWACRPFCLPRMGWEAADGVVGMALL